MVFFNNNRGLKLSKFLTKKKFKIYEVVTKKFLNKKILKKLSKNSRVISNLKSKNLKKFIEKKKFDLIISAGFPHIFQKDFLNLTPYGIINLHAGKLPKYKGGSPLVWQILNNEKKIGLSIIKVNKTIDGGKIISYANFKNNRKDNISQIQNKADRVFLNLTINALKKIEKNQKLKKQPQSKSYFHQRKDKDALINFTDNNLKIYNLVRSQSYPYKGAFFYNNRRKFRLTKCAISNLNPKLLPGEIFRFKNKKNIYIKSRKNSVQIIDLIPGERFLKGVITL